MGASRVVCCANPACHEARREGVGRSNRGFSTLNKGGATFYIFDRSANARSVHLVPLLMSIPNVGKCRKGYRRLWDNTRGGTRVYQRGNKNKGYTGRLYTLRGD